MQIAVIEFARNVLKIADANSGEFDELVRKGAFYEWALVHQNRYGTLKSTVQEQLAQGHDLILEIDVVGALNAKRLMPESAVLIMIAPPSLEELEKRLAGRGSEGEASLKERMQRVKYELEQQPLYDYVVINDDLQHAKREIQEIIRKEKEKKI